MSAYDTAALQIAATDHDRDRIDRALTECMTTLPRASGLYPVIGQHSGPEYTVDVQDGRCTCPDAQYNLEDEEACKHELRVEFATGARAIPEKIPKDDVDPLLGEHIDQPTRTDGGTTTNPDTQASRADDLQLVDTGAGSIVFQQLTEFRDGRDIVVAKRLLGFYRVTNWDAIRDAVHARGYGAGDVLHRPEFETLEEARKATEGAE